MTDSKALGHDMVVVIGDRHTIGSLDPLQSVLSTVHRWTSCGSVRRRRWCWLPTRSTR